jgi:hypothetical protein
MFAKTLFQLMANSVLLQKHMLAAWCIMHDTYTYTVEQPANLSQYLSSFDIQIEGQQACNIQLQGLIQCNTRATYAQYWMFQLSVVFARAPSQHSGFTFTRSSSMTTCLERLCKLLLCC